MEVGCIGSHIYKVLVFYVKMGRDVCTCVYKGLDYTSLFVDCVLLLCVIVKFAFAFILWLFKAYH
jgi:hypothetical protein